MAVVIAATVQDVYPPRVLVSVTGLTLGDAVDVYRVVSNERTLVRAGSELDVTDPAFIRVDAELPYGTPVSYLAVVNNTTEYATTPTTYNLPVANRDVLTDAITGASAEALRMAQEEWTYSPNISVYRAGGRVVVQSGDVGGYQSTIQFVVFSKSSEENLTALLTSSTQRVIQLRDSLGEADYICVLDWRKRRFSQDRTDERRIFVCDVQQVSGWAAALEARSFTLGDIAAYYGVSGTLADIAADHTSLLSIAQGDYS